MRVFSKKFVTWMRSHERDALFYGVIVIYLAVAIVGFFWHRETTELRIGFVTNMGICSSDSDFDQNIFTQKAQNFVTQTDQNRVHFNVALGNTVLYEKKDCEENALADFSWAQTLFEQHDDMHFVLGSEDVISKDVAYQNWLMIIERDVTYYSFDRKNTHVIVLDTALGGDTLSPECDDITQCQEANHRWQFLRTLLKDPSTLADYLERHDTTEEAVREERNAKRQIVEAQDFVIDQTRSKDRRRDGRIGETQLRWLREDLAQTNKERVLILSYHPLFFADEGGDAPIDIGNRDSATLIFKESGKDIVSISGGTQEAREHQDGNIRYFSIENFTKPTGPWTYLSWSAQNFIFEKK